LINNRQGGRRRGRGGQRGQNLGGQPGNRQDNRQRGNAAQLLEKYKSMARDAQLAGDRVQTEYYLQYADHYFRILSENRARFEDQRPRREPELDEDEGDEELVETNEEGAAEERADRQDRSERHDRGDRFNRERRPRRNERSDREATESEGQANGGGETIPFDVLPPAIGRDDVEAADDDSQGPRRPRRRSRSPRPPEGEDEIAPAA
jgi:Domain of unknown function (DUF4167)